MTGRRVYPDDEGQLRLAPGDYGQDASGVWYARAPRMSTGCLVGHNIVEHEDGTITVSPLMVIDHGARGTWHGFLERGVWREV